MPSEELYQKVIDTMLLGPIKPTRLAAKLFMDTVDWSKSKEVIIVQIYSNFGPFRNEVGQVIADLTIQGKISRLENSDLHINKE
jgi:hypothetical protein